MRGKNKSPNLSKQNECLSDLWVWKESFYFS